MKCNKCGAQVSENAVFCNNCGSKISHENAGDFEVQKHCMVCGAVLNQGASFCSECGTSLKPEPGRRTSRNKQKNNNTVIILTIILFALIIGLGCFIKWIVFGNNSNEQQKEEFVMPSVQSVVDEDAYRKDSEKDTQSDKDAEETQNQEEETAEEEEKEPEESDTEFLFPTHERYITERDLEGLDKDEVALIRNEIYARHGFVFKTEPYKSYFSDKDWYEPNEAFSESMFNSYEKENKSFIVEYEKAMGWR